MIDYEHGSTTECAVSLILLPTPPRQGDEFLLPGRMVIMAATYDPLTPAGEVRLLISDISEPFIFQDNEIQAFLSMRKNSPLRAASSALMAIASNEALLYKYIRTDDLTVDGVKGATEIRLQARQLESQADSEEEFFLLTFPGCNQYSRGLEYEEHWHGGW